MNDKQLASPSDMAAKVNAAKRASRDLVIIARTNAAASEGIDGAVERAKLDLIRYYDYEALDRNIIAAVLPS